MTPPFRDSILASIVDPSRDEVPREYSECDKATACLAEVNRHSSFVICGTGGSDDRFQHAEQCAADCAGKHETEDAEGELPCHE